MAYAATYSFFPIVLNTIAGFSGVEAALRSRRARHGGRRRAQFRYIYLPAALPVTLTVGIGFFICIASVLGGETLAVGGRYRQVDR